jgi:hypothetical protein
MVTHGYAQQRPHIQPNVTGAPRLHEAETRVGRLPTVPRAWIDKRRGRSVLTAAAPARVGVLELAAVVALFCTGDIAGVVASCYANQCREH